MAKIKLADEVVELVFLLFSIEDDKLNCGAFLDTFMKHRNTHVLVQVGAFQSCTEQEQYCFDFKIGPYHLRQN